MRGLEPGDWDVASDAPPEIVDGLFPDTTWTNIFGTVTVRAGGLDVEVTDLEAPFMDAHARFLDDWEPEWVATEQMVVSLRHGYGGTFDALTIIEHRTWLLDWKTSSFLSIGCACGRCSPTCSTMR